MKITDIARLANVSKSAVSIALNNKPGISDETRKKILDIIEENNYTPKRKKTAKQPNKTIRFVACYNDDIDIITKHYQSLSFFNELLKHLTNEVKDFPFTLIISSVSTQNLHKELRNLEETRETDGYIVLGTNLTEEEIMVIKLIKNESVFIDTCYTNLDCDFVTMNNQQGLFDSTMNLINQGHTEIGYAMGTPRFFNFNEREKGFWKAIHQNGLTIKKEHILTFPAMTIETKTEDLEQLKKSNKMPTAFVCENDSIAISILKSLKMLGYKIPNDVSIVGFDNISETGIVSPELTTMNVRKDLIARNSLRILANKFNSDHTSNQQILINANLVERGSVKNIIKEKSSTKYNRAFYSI